MAVTLVVKTYGTTGTFSTPQLAEDGKPANLTTANNWTAGTFLVAAFIQGEVVTGVGVTGGKMLDTDSTGAGTGTYITFGTTTTPLVGATITGSTSGATCVLTGSANVGVIWQAQQQNQEFSGTGTQLTIAGSTTSSTCYTEFTTVAGASFKDNANKLTNALRYNASNGAGIRGTSATTLTLSNGEANVRLSKLQISASGSAGRPLSADADAIYEFLVVEGLITAANSFQGILGCTTGTGNKTIKNCLFIQRASGASHIIGTSTCTPSFYNCTFVAPDDLATAPTQVILSGASGTVTVQNCGMFAGADKPTAGGSATFNFTTCFGDDSTPASGITAATFSSEFENVTDATRDFRLKQGSAQINTGTTDATNAPTDIVGTTRPKLGSYDVGCWEWSTNMQSPGLGFQGMPEGFNASGDAILPQTLHTIEQGIGL